MSDTIYSNSFRLKEGAEIELPEKVGRKNVKFESGNVKSDTKQAVVVGEGALEPYILLSVDAGAADVPEGEKEVIGFEITTQTLWFAIPKSQYGGGGS